MLLSLNDDCLRLVIEKLPLEDQISCVFVCKRMKMLITEIWKLEKTVFIGGHRLSNMPLEYLVEYLSCISNNVEDLGLNEFDLNDLKNIEFPNVHSLVYIKRGNYPADSEKLIKNIFPNLTKLRLDGSFTGSHLHELTNLETLELTGCRDLEERYFENIYSKLKKVKKLSLWYFDDYEASDYLLKKIVNCETLEEVLIEGYHFVLVYEELFKLKKLKKIECFCWSLVEDIFRYITKKYGGVLHTIAFTGDWDYISNDFCQNIQKLIALQKLIFYNIEKRRDDQFKTIAASLSPTLEEFYYREEDFGNSNNYDGLLEIVRRYTKLKILDLTNTEIDLNFVKNVAAIIASTDVERNQVLLMNCNSTNVKIEDLKTFHLSEKLQISFEFKSLGKQQWRKPYIYCEWNTPDENN